LPCLFACFAIDSDKKWRRVRRRVFPQRHADAGACEEGGNNLGWCRWIASPAHVVRCWTTAASRSLWCKLTTNAPSHTHLWWALENNSSTNHVWIFRLTLWQSRPNKAVLKCPSVCPYVYLSNEIWYVGRGRWVMPDGMQYDPIQGQGQGHEPFNVGNTAIFNSYLPHYLWRELATNHRFLN